MSRAINPRPGVVVCIANGRGEIVLHDPGALARQARIRAEREERRRREAAMQMDHSGREDGT